MATNPKVRWTEHMPEDGEMRAYLVRIPDENINHVRKKLKKAGITLIAHEAVLFPESAEPPCGADAERIAASINEYAEHNGLTPNIKEKPGSREDGLALEEISELWELAELFHWEETTIIGPRAQDITQEDWEQECDERTHLITQPDA